ncbi:MAG: hypothetical protein CFE37_00295 [Alphaproteobacteria bacterium PA4]|nr:MAG: hypothetical protein CFE37_00295 [Alphaproteobacteria bacterium PA4]
MRPVAIATITGLALSLLAVPALAKDKVPPPPVKVIGEPINCVNVRNIRQTKVVDDQTIDFVMTGNKIYRNTLPMSCPRLGFERAFMYQTSVAQLCNVDIITVLQQGGGNVRGASCGLGKFTPIEPPAKK